MSYEKLTSDKVNYLIWRYLQEAGFGQTAARLQYDWGLQHHPDDLPFAKHIGPRSLIKLMHYGLKLHRIQLSDKPNATRFFGPDPDSIIAIESITTTSTSTALRPKSTSPARRLETNLTQSSSLSAPSTASKPRIRRSNGSTTNANGRSRGTNAAASAESMDVDQSGAPIDNNDMDIDENDYTKKKATDEIISSLSSPVKNGEPQQIATNGLEFHGPNHHVQEQQPIPLPIPTLTTGASIGVQSDKIIELAPMTQLLDVSNIKDKVINHAEWCPYNSDSSSILAIGGKQFGQIWEINQMQSIQDIQATSVSATSAPNATPVLTPTNIMKLNVRQGHAIVSLAWSPRGDRLAYSTFSDHATGIQRSIIQIRSRSTGEDIDMFSILGEAVTNLRWNSSGRFLAAICHHSVVIYDAMLGTQLRPLNTHHFLYDIAWVDGDTVVVCGDAYIATVRVDGSDVTVEHSFANIAGSTEWTKLRFDNSSMTVAITSETAKELVLIYEGGDYTKEVNAHAAAIVDLAFQPTASTTTDGARLLATSAIDGTISVWDSKCPGSKKSLVMGGISQALTPSFSPDGTMLAVADWDKVLFWDLGRDTQPRYKWELRRVDWQSFPNGLPTNGVNHDHDISMEETDSDAPILTWDGPGHSLTFAHKDKLAVINVPR